MPVECQMGAFSNFHWRNQRMLMIHWASFLPPSPFITPSVRLLSPLSISFFFFFFISLQTFLHPSFLITLFKCHFHQQISRNDLRFREDVEGTVYALREFSVQLNPLKLCVI